MSFKLARLEGQSVKNHVQLPYASGSTFPQGALVLRNASNEWAECGADPVAIGGVSEHGVGADTLGYGGHGYKEFPPGYAIVIPVQGETRFLAKYVGTLPAVDGGSYGVVKDADGDWKVDFAETVATRVKLVGRRTGSPENLALVEVTFLAANVQIQ